MGKKKKGNSRKEPENLIPFEQEKEKFLGMIGNVLSDKDFSSAEEATQFLNEAFTGRSMSDSLAEWDTRPPSLLDEAHDVLDRIDPDAPLTSQRRYAKKALDITPDCMEAWETLAWSYESPKKIEEAHLKGIAHGRELHADLIAEIDEQHGLWGYVEARPFMRLFESLADFYSQDGLAEKVLDVHEQMLALNPGDNQGIRGPLLNGYIKLDRLDEAQRLVEQFPDDMDLGIVYGRVLLELVKTLDTDYDFETILKKDHNGRLAPSTFDNQVFTKAKTLMREAIKLNPYVPLLIEHPTSMYLESPPYYQMGSPDEAMNFIKHYGIDWFGSIIGWVFMGAFSAQAKARINKDKTAMRNSYKDLLSYLDGIDETPWQSVLIEEMDKFR